MAQAVMIYTRPPWLLHVYMKKADYMEMDNHQTDLNEYRDNWRPNLNEYIDK